MPVHSAREDAVKPARLGGGPFPSFRVAVDAMKRTESVEDGRDQRTCTEALADGGCTDSLKYALSPGRFSLLVLYSLASFMAALVWNIMAPVYAIAEARFLKGPQAINSLANVRIHATARGGTARRAAARRLWMC